VSLDLRQEDGAASVEYATIAALISIAAVSVMATLGTQVQGLFTSFLNAFP